MRWLLLLATLGCAAGATAQGSELTDQVDQIFSEWDSTSSPGCALSVIKDGEVAYSRGYGMANLEHGLAITPQTVFRIGSTSKQFTAAATALLAEQGEISLDDDIRKYLPEIPAYSAPITIRQLIHHTSGLRDYLSLMSFSGFGAFDYYTDTEVIAKLAAQRQPNFAPGEDHLYSNSGYFLLSVIIERVSGQSLREFAQTHIFSALGMRHSHFHDDHRHIVAQRAAGYSRTNEAGFEISQTTLGMVGDGGVFTSLEDLFHWDQNFYQNRLGQGGPALLEQLHTPGELNNGEVLTYAYGLSVSDYRGLRKVSHGGAFVGYRAEMIRFPEEALSVICLCNLAQTNPSALAQSVADVYLGDRLAASTATGSESTQSEALKITPALVGSYFSPERGRLLKLEKRDQQWVLIRSPGVENPLVAIADGRFEVTGFPIEAEVYLRRPATGSETELVLQLSGRAPRPFGRVDEISLSAQELSTYAGRYYSAELDVEFLLSESAPGLLLQMGDEELTLQPAKADVFTGSVTLEFGSAEDGSVDHFSLGAGRISGIDFQRR